MLLYEHNLACTLRETGQVEEARRHMRDSIPQVLRINEPDLLVVLAEDYAAVLADLGDHLTAVRLLGAADAMRERLATPRPPAHQAEIAGPISKTRVALSDEEWEAAHKQGRDTTVETALLDAHAASTPNS